MVEDLEKVLNDFMTNRKLKRTPQRRKLLLSIFSSKDHFTADQLYDRLRESAKVDKGESIISRATIYRTLALLVEAGLLREIHLGGGLVHYDPNFAENPDHAHMICLICGNVEEVDDEDLVQFVNRIAKLHGFVVAHRTIKLEGICAHCRSLGKTLENIK